MPFLLVSAGVAGPVIFGYLFGLFILWMGAALERPAKHKVRRARKAKSPVTGESRHRARLSQVQS